MGNQRAHTEEAWISLILRLAIASLFGAAAVNKFVGGTEGVVKYFESIFATTWLPASMVTLQAQAVPYVEALIAIWLVLGCFLRVGWIFTSLFMISLAFGMTVAQKYDSAMHNYILVFVCTMGLYYSKFDRFSLGKNKNCCPYNSSEEEKSCPTKETEEYTL
jgi:uncharacterized membrane protein YphA (DoxX/SURF4 family)